MEWFTKFYPFTFVDANGDGIGDIQAIIKKLDYLNSGKTNEKSLGADAIWLLLINASPMHDNGYDVSDYYDICPIFGKLADFDTLISEYHQRHIRVILDLVVNHISEQHS